MQLGVGIDRRARKRDRRGQPPPHRGDQTQGYQEKRQRRTKRNRFHPPAGRRRLAGQRRSAKSGLERYVTRVRATVLPRCDKVVSLLDKIRNIRHGIPLGCPRRIGDLFGRHLASRRAAWIICREFSRRRKQIGEFMRRRVLEFKDTVLRHFAVSGLVLLIGIGGAFAQSGDPRAQDQAKQPSANPADAPAPRTTSARPTNSSRPRRPSTARPATRNASGSAAAWFA